MQQCRVWFSCSYSRLNSRDPSVAAERRAEPDHPPATVGEDSVLADTPRTALLASSES